MECTIFQASHKKMNLIYRLVKDWCTHLNQAQMPGVGTRGLVKLVLHWVCCHLHKLERLGVHTVPELRLPDTLQNNLGSR